MSIELTEFQNAIMGLVCGGFEVTSLQWTNYLKNASQQSLPFTMDPRVLYRGYLPNLVNMAGCTMWQFAVCGLIKNMLVGGKDRSLTSTESILSGLGGGVSSAIIGGPLELAMIQQQRKGGSLMSHASTLLSPNAARGITMTAAREGIWTVGYLSLPGVLRKELMSRRPDIFSTDDMARAPAALISGLVCCLLSHPFDTVKTCMQGDIERKTFGNVTQTFGEIYRTSGIRGFYRGTAWRYGRQATAIFLIDKLRMELSPVVFPAQFQ